MNAQPKSVALVLLLGGTTEATALAARLATDPRFAAVLSLAGRTAHPALSVLPVRVGGFGGIEGLAQFIRAERIDLVVDATHPFAAQISANAIGACAATKCRLVALERPPWVHQEGDRWQLFPAVGDAIDALPVEPTCVFSGLGRLSLDALEEAPQHHYIIRLVDPLLKPLALPNVTIIRGRGPYKTADDITLFEEHDVAFVLAKNAGGLATISKIEAARTLGLTVMMIGRPKFPARPTVATVEAAWLEICSHATPPTDRGV